MIQISTFRDHKELIQAISWFEILQLFGAILVITLLTPVIIFCPKLSDKIMGDGGS